MQLLRPKEVMIKLAVSRGKVYQMIRDGIIPSVNIDGCLRVPEESLHEFIREQLDQAGKTAAPAERVYVLFGGKAERSRVENGS
ncbi:MAG: helix-turn-helix domain-containing protein [Firmicutes bacterium]|nr:helix-turn-helix domain-containing protein [Bacillota bacterium]